MAVRVFQVDHDVDRFQTICVDTGNVLEGFCFDGQRVSDSWEPPPVYPQPQTHAVPDIWAVEAFAVLVLSPGVYEILSEWLEYEERLDLPMGSEVLDVINVLNTPNVLDLDATESIGGPSALITKYAFHARRFEGNRSLFRLPGTVYGPLYCWEDSDDEEAGFRHGVRSNGVTGLLFEECWNSSVKDHPFSAFRTPSRDDLF